VQFVSALSDQFVSGTLQLKGITSLRIVIERTKTIKLIQENNFEQRKKNVNVEGRGENKNNNNLNGNFNREAKDCKKDFGNNTKEKEGKFKKNKFEANKNNKRKRIGSGKKGHFRSECPGKQENKE